MEASSAPQATTQERSASDQPPTTSPKSPRIDSQGTICDDDPPPIDNTGGSAKTSPPSLSKSLYLEKPSISPDFANAKPATCPLPSYNPPKSPTFDKPETLSHETLPKAEVHPMEFFTEPPAILGGPTPVPINQPRTIWHRILYPTGVTPHHSRYEHWIGRIGFGGKGVVYGMVGGMICASARRIYGEINGSPQGAFVLIGDFPVGGKALLVVMLMALMAYICWRWWEAFTFQGADATFSPFKNFFSYRLSPLVSGCVYVAYTYYIIEVLANHSTSVCYPDCWRETTLGHVGLALFGVAFAIACVTQLLNAFTRKWHPEMNWARCNVYEKWTLLILGHIGFLGRAGLFLFVSVLMFRVYRTPVRQSGNTIANGINQFVDSRTGRAFMYIVGTLTAAYGVFALLCTHYRFFPTPPPSGIPLFYHPRTENGSELDRSVTMRNQRVERNRQGMLRVNDNEDLAQGAASMGSGPAVVVDDVAGPSNYQTTTSTNHANKVISSVIDDVIDNVVSNNNNHNTQNSENENENNQNTSDLQNTPIQNNINSENTIQNSPNNVILDNFSPNTTNLQNSQSKLQASAIDEVDT